MRVPVGIGFVSVIMPFVSMVMSFVAVTFMIVGLVNFLAVRVVVFGSL